MNLDLAIMGSGAVTPAGVGVEALLRGNATPTMVEECRRSGHTWPVLRVNLKDPAFDRWQREPRLRRASPVSFFLVEAANQALAGASPEERAQTGLIVVFSAGCLAYSHRFYEQIVKQGQRAASPALFPETVFNSPVSHVATVLGLNGAAYALVGDEGAWVSALITASIWLKQEHVQQVLVLGAEEFDPLVLDAYRSALWLSKDNPHGFLTSEGAAGLLLRPAGDKNTPLIARAEDGWIYRTKKEAAAAGAELMGKADATTPVFRTARHNWLASLEARLLKDRITAPESPYLGEAILASAAWQTIQAAAMLGPERPRLFLPFWGLNHQFASIELAIAK